MNSHLTHLTINNLIYLTHLTINKRIEAAKNSRKLLEWPP